MTAGFFFRYGKGNRKAKAKAMVKGLDGHTSIDCTVSTEWATKIYGRENGKTGEIVNNPMGKGRKL